jgi:hypothetical protein
MVTSLVLAFALQTPTLAQVEDRLCRNGYLDSLFETKWAIAQGAKIVPILDKMLGQKKKYADVGKYTGAFPFNAEYALAHIDVPAAQAALKKHKVTYGLQGWNLRRKMKSQSYGVVYKDSALSPKPSGEIGSALILKPGTEVKILKAAVENPNEEGARGGPATFAYVEVLATKQKGYVQLAADVFDPFF